ncbi:MAG: acyloxyacyl hydrolase [Chlorobiaceae bacterium]|nr:acyloxyacyl hydrolase [Chlorobiaceae bacterium]
MIISKQRFFCLFISLLAIIVAGSPLPAIAQTIRDNPDTGNSDRGLYLDELAVGTGYIRSSFQHGAEDLSGYPVFVRLGFSLNSLAGIRSGHKSLQLILEPFINPISAETDGVEAGCGIGLRYLHELSRPLDIYIEGNIAPMYLGIETTEQGEAGFNFLSQAGAGLRYRITKNNAIFGGYRFRHISHAGIMDRSNDGINSHAFVIGISWLY